ncbi:hypothetical protein SCHPADRAFT_293354 [Schizopora paradoxa]|uniref:DUF6534 domain-containing protein n=1 Tax=Schizopora paradoxa TaxID=27342 RepID=A0A0H2RSG5_9AGAM|nr:hypothetical protein SCHPADRAFT_293354 [Schizopora paradoxa]
MGFSCVLTTRPVTYTPGLRQNWRAPVFPLMHDWLSAVTPLDPPVFLPTIHSQKLLLMIQPTIDTTFGAAFVGLVTSAVLYGLTLLQTYSYFGRFPRDPLHLKITVFVLWILDTLHLGLCTTAIYWYLVRNFNNQAQLAFTHWTMNLQTDCNGVIGFVVELFFAQRVWKVSKNMFLTGIICVLAFLHCGLGIYFTVQAFILKEFSRYSQLTVSRFTSFKSVLLQISNTFQWVTSVGLGGAAAADIIIAVSLVYFLGKNRTGFEATDSLITTLMIYAINTGLLTSICASLAVICFAIMPLNFIWLSFFWCLGKLYVNSLLASLNSRMQLRERISPSDGTFVNLTNLRSDGALQSPGINRRFSRSSGMVRAFTSFFSTSR